MEKILIKNDTYRENFYLLFLFFNNYCMHINIIKGKDIIFNRRMGEGTLPSGAKTLGKNSSESLISKSKSRVGLAIRFKKFHATFARLMSLI